MRKNLFARILRASGRLLLFAGAALGLGLTLIHIYLQFYQLQHPDIKVVPSEIITKVTDTSAGISEDATATITNVALIILCCLGATILFFVIAKIYNDHMRRIIYHLAHVFHAQIFTVEIVGTIIAWTVATLLFISFIPAASLISIFAFIINELLFIFAWGAYGQPDYKI